MTWLLTLALTVCAVPADLAGFTADHTRGYEVGGLPVTLTITAVDAEGAPVETFCGPAEVEGVSVKVANELVPLTETGTFTGGATVLKDVVITGELAISAGEIRSAPDHDARTLPGWLSLLPPILAVLLAVFLRQALLALFAGIWIGATFIHGYNPLSALIRCFDTYLPKTFDDSGHAAIIFFTMALGGMVGIIAKTGGTRALVDAISARAKTRRSGMLTAYFSGIVVFFDDYANCLLVGNTVRPFTDKLRVSREKLAFIVDSTAAPIATVALVSTWIGYQISVLEDSLGGEIYGVTSGYDLFLSMLPYSFYSFFSLGFVLFISVSLRDYGPMLEAERRALHDGHLFRPGSRPLMDTELTDMEPASSDNAHWITAVVPVASVVLIVFVGLYINGRQALGDAAGDAGIRDIIANADSYAVLLWASFGGSVIALGTGLATRTITLPDSVDAWIGGVKAMTMAVLILILAWGLGDMCKLLQTGPWILDQVSPSPHWLPVITFAISGVIALATGSSFSTMAIVIPIAGPMAWALTGDGTGIESGTADAIRHATLAAVLSGAVFGDHCSPISDTTIMSSMSAASDHVDHVRTQAPYAATCALAAAAFGFIPAGYGVSPWISLPLGLGGLAAVVWFAGKRVE